MPVAQPGAPKCPPFASLCECNKNHYYFFVGIHFQYFKTTLLIRNELQNDLFFFVFAPDLTPMLLQTRHGLCNLGRTRCLALLLIWLPSVSPTSTLATTTPTTTPTAACPGFAIVEDRGQASSFFCGRVVCHLDCHSSMPHKLLTDTATYTCTQHSHLQVIYSPAR